MSVTIRPVTVSDLEGLESVFGAGGYFAGRLADAQSGRCVLLAAWSGSEPVAHGYLWDCAEPESPQHLTAIDAVRTHLAGVPLIQSLYVASGHRRRGIGRAMVEAIEQAARDRGHAKVALGADPGDVPAFRLYQGLGYREWLHGMIEVTYEGLSEDGEKQWFIETGVMMEKVL